MPTANRAAEHSGPSHHGDVWSSYRRALLARSWSGLLIGFAGALLVGIWLRSVFPDLAGTDTYAYWIVDPTDPYSSVFPQRGTFLYSPAMAMLMAPLGLLPWEVVAAGWLVVQALVLAALLGPLGAIVAMSVIVGVDLLYGNVAIFMMAVTVVGFRWPALWALPVLAKVTPVVGLVWFAARSEWRNLGIALGTLGVLSLVSLVYAPQAWFDWIRLLIDMSAVPSGIAPLWIRWPLAALLTVWGARTNRKWVVPIAVAVSFGHPWPSTYTVAFGAIALFRHDLTGSGGSSESHI